MSASGAVCTQDKPLITGEYSAGRVEILTSIRVASFSVHLVFEESNRLHCACGRPLVSFDSILTNTPAILLSPCRVQPQHVCKKCAMIARTEIIDYLIIITITLMHKALINQNFK